MKIVENGPKNVWRHIAKVLYYMLNKGIFRHKFMMDLNLRLLRHKSKIAGKAIIGNLLNHHYLRHHHHHCQYVDTTRPVYFGMEVMKTAVKESPMSMSDEEEEEIGSQMEVMKTTVMESPMSMSDEEEEEIGSQVDRDAEEFISRFYEQLRLEELGL